MAKEKQKPSSFMVFALILAVLAFLMSAVALFVAYDSGKLTRRARMLVEEIRGSLNKKTLEDEWNQIQAKLADAKESLVEYKDTHLTMAKLQEAKQMLLSYKEKITPEYKEKVQSLAEKTESVIESVKEQGKNAGEKIDSLMQAVDRVFKPEATVSEKGAPSKETVPETTPTN
jgi:gas vesicle protein